jgi:hypothetical protein
MTLVHTSGIGNFAVAGGTVPTYDQQTFLGASIVNFTISAGFGDSSSTLGIELVEDEYNSGDGTGLGLGCDVYHSGKNDRFSPPPVGSPVFFTFGLNRAPIKEAFKKTFDDLYGLSTASATGTSGYYNLNFGGILQTYTQNRSNSNIAAYSVQVVDPREILTNVQIILNNYAGSNYSMPNVFNVYGFLEFDSINYDNATYFKDPLKTSRLQKYYYPNTDTTNFGKYYYSGVDMYYNTTVPTSGLYEDATTFDYGKSGSAWVNPPTPLGNKFPITGVGMSRRGPHGIPYYRVVQAMNAIFGYDLYKGELPAEYKDAGFAGYINFRGLNYVVDLAGLPALPQFYFLDYDQISLMDLCLEICDVTNHDLFVSLLPVIDHRACQTLYNHNKDLITAGGSGVKDIVAGIIKISTIDRSRPPSLSAIKTYIDNLQTYIPIQNRDVGYELSNVVTDKFIVGAQEVDMYYFTTNTDKDKMSAKTCGYNQWSLEASYMQQVLPFYGFIGEAVTIPKGFGSYQQILLDSSSLNANGVGNYYVATEMELRAASISFEKWSEFLLQYNDIYMESIDGDDIRDAMAIAMTPTADSDEPPVMLESTYKVTVPRSVWNSDTPSYGTDGLPVSACNPPYGYPLYYKRATQIGLPQAGLANTAATSTKLFTQLATLKNCKTGKQFQVVLNTIWKEIQGKINDATLSVAEKGLYNSIKTAKDRLDTAIAAAGSGNSLDSWFAAYNTQMKLIVDNNLNQLGPVVAGSSRIAKKNLDNAKKVYDFVKGVSDECLGKKFLVKIPNHVNTVYQKQVEQDAGNSGLITKGPFGFKPRSASSDPLYTFSPTAGSLGMTFDYLSPPSSIAANMYGGLKVGKNPIIDDYEFNYAPENLGGYYRFDMVAVTGGVTYGTKYGLIPQDASNFMKENRIGAYVRFDRSEFLSFDGLNKDSYSTQAIVSDYFIPDISYQLENSTNANDALNPDDAETSGKIPSVTFVKCELSDKFYMPPKSSTSGVAVHGGTTTYDIVFSSPNKIFDPDTCEYVNSFTYGKRLYKPSPSAGGTQQVKVFNCITDPVLISGRPTLELDTGNVYALITLPSKVVATITSRFRDGLSNQYNVTNYKHFLLMDVVNGVAGFETPAAATSSGTRDFVGSYGLSGFGPDAEAAIRKSFEGLTFALPNKINMAAPSPIYPDLVALPLRSLERCYGPWLSSYVTADRVGGKVEFVKDENLSPWNYNGYDLMNEAGHLMAEFGSSAMLCAERGGFVVPMAPSGIALATALGNAGPLVTDISVSVSTEGIKTTFKMDLYTASFGKMQKQKKDVISNISRNRQKQLDERNALIRKGLGKNQMGINYNMMYDQMNRNTQNILARNAEIFQNIPYDISVYSSRAKPQGGSVKTTGDQKVGDGVSWHGVTSYHKEASRMSSTMLSQSFSQFTTELDMSRAYNSTASSDITSEQAPCDTSNPDHVSMSALGQCEVDSIIQSNRPQENLEVRVASFSSNINKFIS